MALSKPHVTRWQCIGMALHTVITPALQDFVKTTITQLYDYLCKNNRIDKQGNQETYKQHGTFQLVYLNINGNDQYHTNCKKKCHCQSNWNFSVLTAVDFAKLFMPSFMCHCSNFTDMDSSALLGLIKNVDDSNTLNNFTTVRHDANDLKDIRNQWGHTDFSEFTHSMFNDSLKIMVNILTKIGANAQFQTDLKTLKDQETTYATVDLKQMQAVQAMLHKELTTMSKLDHRVDEQDKELDNLRKVYELLKADINNIKKRLAEQEAELTEVRRIQSDQTEHLKLQEQQISALEKPTSTGQISSEDKGAIISHYLDSLTKFHEASLRKLAQTKPQLHDPSKYLKLRIYRDKLAFREFEDPEDYEQAYFDDQIFENRFQQLRLYKYRERKEYENTSSMHGDEDIQLDKLFSTTERDQHEPRTVAILGVPGSGKTLTFHYLLQEIINGNMYKGQVDFVFTIILRTLNACSDDVSFQRFLFCHQGPQLPLPGLQFSAEQTSKVILDSLNSNQKRVMVLLDGFDEAHGLGVKHDARISDAIHSSLDEIAKPQILIHNLIKGTILQDARVLVTSRPHCASQLANDGHNIRLVHLDVFTEKNLVQYIQAELSPGLGKSLIDYIRKRPNILEFCKIPLHARDLVAYIKWQHRRNPEGPLDIDKMPKSLSALYFVLNIMMLRICDRNLPVSDSMSDMQILKSKGGLMTKLARLASKGLLEGQIKQLFDDEDLHSVGLETDDVVGSILTCTEAWIDGATGPVRKTFFGYSHYTQQENLSGLQGLEIPVEEMEKLATNNRGELDEVLIHYLGAAGDPWVRSMLPHIFPSVSPNQVKANAVCVLQAIWASPRRWQGCDGEEYVLRCLQESQLHDKATQLVPPLYTCTGMWNVGREWYIRHRSSIAQMHVATYLRHLPPSTVKCLSMNKSSHISLYRQVLDGQLPAVTGIRIFISSDEEMHQLCTDLSAPHHLQSLWLECYTESAWNMFYAARLTNLKAVYLVGDPHNTTLDVKCLCQCLSGCTSLHSLGLCMFSLHTTSQSQVKQLTSLRNLVLKQCKFGEDMRLWNSGGLDAAFQAFMHQHLKALWLQYTDLGVRGADKLSDQVNKNICKPQVLQIWDESVTKPSWRSLCRALGASCITAVDLHQRGKRRKIYGPELEVVASAFNNNVTLQEVSVHANTVEEIRLLCGIITNNTIVQRLDLSNNMITRKVANLLGEALQGITTLRSLIMRHCELTNAALDHFIPILRYKGHITMFDIYGNGALDVSAIVQLTCGSSIEVLDVRCCGIKSESDGLTLAQTLCDNEALQVLGFGQLKVPLLGKDDDAGACRALVAELYRSYPSNGPLKTLVLPDDVDGCKPAGSELALKLNKPNLILNDKWPYTDLALLTGRRYMSLTQDTHNWLIHSMVTEDR